MAKKRYHHGDLERTLVEAALDAIEELGLERLSLRAVAERAGVSAAAPYHHFKSKEDLVASAAVSATREFNEQLKSAACSIAEPRQQLSALGIAYVRYASKRPRMFRLIQGPYLTGEKEPPELAGERAITFSILFAAIQGCLPKAGEQAQRQAFASAWSLVHGLSVLCIDRRMQAILPNQSPETIAEFLVEALDLNPKGASS